MYQLVNWDNLFLFIIFQWEFDYIDKNKNNVLDNEEVGRIFFDLLNAEPCIEGFLLSCDQNEKEGIERREWDSCFPKTAGNIWPEIYQVWLQQTTRHR